MPCGKTNQWLPEALLFPSSAAVPGLKGNHIPKTNQLIALIHSFADYFQRGCPMQVTLLRSVCTPNHPRCAGRSLSIPFVLSNSSFSLFLCLASGEVTTTASGFVSFNTIVVHVHQKEACSLMKRCKLLSCEYFFSSAWFTSDPASAITSTFPCASEQLSMVLSCGSSSDIRLIDQLIHKTLLQEQTFLYPDLPQCRIYFE